MIGWIILAVIVALIVVLMLIPIGADIRFEEGVIRISAKIAGLKLQLIPEKKTDGKKEKAEKEKKPHEEKKREDAKDKADKKKRSLPFNGEEMIDLIKTGLSGFGRFGRQFRVERFVFHWVCAGLSPYPNARLFSFVNAGLSQLAPICSERFRCRNTSVWTDIDFVREDMFFEFGLTMTIRIGQIVRTVLRMAFEALIIILRSKKRRKAEEKEEALYIKAESEGFDTSHLDEPAENENERKTA